MEIIPFYEVSLLSHNIFKKHHDTKLRENV